MNQSVISASPRWRCRARHRERPARAEATTPRSALPGRTEKCQAAAAKDRMPAPIKLPDHRAGAEPRSLSTVWSNSANRAMSSARLD